MRRRARPLALVLAAWVALGSGCYTYGFWAVALDPDSPQRVYGDLRSVPMRVTLAVLYTPFLIVGVDWIYVPGFVLGAPLELYDVLTRPQPERAPGDRSDPDGTRPG